MTVDAAQDTLRGPHKHWVEAERTSVLAAEVSPPALFPRSRIKATGRYLAHFVPRSLSRDAVTGLLPRCLELAPQDLVAPNQHPVLFVFGRQQRVRPIIRYGEGLAYLEFLIAIPYLQWRDPGYSYRGPFVYLPRLYLDRWLPVLLGWLCGFAKERAHSESGDGRNRIAALFSRTPLISGAFTPYGNTRRPQDFSGFQRLSEIFSQPLVTQTPFGSMCLDFDWELERARLRAIDAEVRIERAFLPGLSVESFRVDGVDRCALGAFHLDVPWSLSRPFHPSTLGWRKPRPLTGKSLLARPHFRERHVRQSHS
jgi:hypothetical protein